MVEARRVDCGVGSRSPRLDCLVVPVSNFWTTAAKDTPSERIVLFLAFESAAWLLAETWEHLVCGQQLCISNTALCSCDKFHVDSSRHKTWALVRIQTTRSGVTRPHWNKRNAAAPSHAHLRPTWSAVLFRIVFADIKFSRQYSILITRMAIWNSPAQIIAISGDATSYGSKGNALTQRLGSFDSEAQPVSLRSDAFWLSHADRLLQERRFLFRHLRRHLV